ncbi:hypothetical protein SUGI_0958870 [Cryptomeria japonica]|nr:hypothetical protein SUGI_0958870 [Cryptomeria japonica]
MIEGIRKSEVVEKTVQSTQHLDTGSACEFHFYMVMETKEILHCTNPSPFKLFLCRCNRRLDEQRGKRK